MFSSLRHFSHWTTARRCFSSISALPRCWCFLKLNPSSWCHTCILYINLNHPAIQHHSRTHPPPLAHTEKTAHHLTFFFFEWGNVLAIRSHHHTWITLRRPTLPYRSDLVFLHHQPWDRCQKGLILVTWCFNRWFPVVANGNPWTSWQIWKFPPKHFGKGVSRNCVLTFLCLVCVGFWWGIKWSRNEWYEWTFRSFLSRGHSAVIMWPQYMLDQQHSPYCIQYQHRPLLCRSQG